MAVTGLVAAVVKAVDGSDIAAVDAALKSPSVLVHALRSERDAV